MRALLLVPLLASCSFLQSLPQGRFDPGEYDRVTQVRVYTGKIAEQCESPEQVKVLSESLNDSVVELGLYSQGLPHNADVTRMISQLHNLTSEFYKRYDAVGTVSEAYCENKAKIISDSAIIIQQTIGSKVR